MIRTTIMLPEGLKTKAMRQAKKMNLSFGELVREALEMKTNVNRGTPSDDPFFADDALFDEEGDSDLAANHDDYLYGREAK